MYHLSTIHFVTDRRTDRRTDRIMMATAGSTRG